jgi:hypothetical protein
LNCRSATLVFSVDSFIGREDADVILILILTFLFLASCSSEVLWIFLGFANRVESILILLLLLCIPHKCW